jgi:ankyrin repeat protein
MLFISKKARLSLYVTLACCSGVYVTKAMEQEESLKIIKSEEQQEHISPFTNLLSELKALMISFKSKIEGPQDSFLEKLSPDIKAYIISFLVSAENKDKALKNIKALSLTSKEFYNIINDTQVLGNLIVAVSKRYEIPHLYIALAFRNPSALNWFKIYIQQNPQKKEILGLLLVEAAKVRNSKALQLLLENKADVNTADDYGSTSLHWAAFWGHKDIVELLLKYGAKAYVNKANRRGDAPLIMAISNCHNEIVKLLLNAGADVNQKGEHGNTPLFKAVISDNKNIVEVLLDAGADPNIVDNSDNIPLHGAILNNQRDIIKLLLNARSLVNKADEYNRGFHADIETLLGALYIGNIDFIRFVLQCGADVNEEDTDGRTPLIMTALNGRKDMVELLLNVGADVNKKNRWGWTPLYIATTYGYQDIVTLLNSRLPAKTCIIS